MRNFGQSQNMEFESLITCHDDEIVSQTFEFYIIIYEMKS